MHKLSPFIRVNDSFKCMIFNNIFKTLEKIILCKETKYKLLGRTIVCVNFKKINVYLTELSPLTFVLLKIDLKNYNEINTTQITKIVH